MAQGDKFAMSLRLMRWPEPLRAATGKFVHRIRGGLYLTRQTGDLPGHPWSREQSPPGYGLSFQAVGAINWGGGGLPLPRAAGVLSPGPCPRLQCRHLGLRLASLFYRLLLIALQLALASNPVHISTTGKLGIPGVPEWFNGEHQAASPGLSGGGRPSVEFG